jgi:hypothetical protein
MVIRTSPKGGQGELRNAPDRGPGYGAAMDRALISSLAFWADMGVETAYADTPVDRLKPVERRAPALTALKARA